MATKVIILDVGGRKFHTTAAVLSISPWFEHLFTRWDHCIELQEDGSLFIDADPDAFDHLLRFMRRPSKFPLFWTREYGFDYAFYSRLEAEADYFALDDLKEWISKKRYQEAIRVQTFSLNAAREAVKSETHFQPWNLNNRS
jgi:hypothetical protein